MEKRDGAKEIWNDDKNKWTAQKRVKARGGKNGSTEDEPRKHHTPDKRIRHAPHDMRKKADNEDVREGYSSSHSDRKHIPLYKPKEDEN